MPEENKATENAIISKSEYTVKAEASAPLVVGAMKTVWGMRSRNQSLQGMLVELMANTVNHAYPKNDPNVKNTGWWLSVNHDIEKNKVSFVFVDNGVGILETVNLKLGKQILQFTFRNNVDLLNDCFDGLIGSRTKLLNRGQGLPAIKKRFENKIVSNLIVITNNALTHFDNRATAPKFAYCLYK